MIPMSSFWLTLLTGIFFCSSAVLLGLRGIMLRPDTRKYPEAPFFVRTAMFAHMLAISLIGLTMVFDAMEGTATLSPPAMIIVAFTSMVHSACMLANILMQRRPVKFWVRMQRIFNLSSCPVPGFEDERMRNAMAVDAGVTVAQPKASEGTAAVALLAAEGADVAGPNESPAAYVAGNAR